MGQQMIALEYKTEIITPESGKLIRGEGTGGYPVNLVTALGSLVKTSQNIHQG